MSLEQAIERNTAAIERLIEILTLPVQVTDVVGNQVKATTHYTGPVFAEETAELQPAAAGAGATKAKRARKEAAKEPTGEPATPAASTPAETAPSPEPTAAPAQTTEDAAAPTEPLTYAQVQAATLAAVKAGRRAEVVKILDGYGVKRADQLHEDQWPEYMAAVEAL